MVSDLHAINEDYLCMVSIRWAVTNVSLVNWLLLVDEKCNVHTYRTCVQNKLETANNKGYNISPCMQLAINK